MITLVTINSPPTTCAYLPNQIWQMRYTYVLEATPLDYQRRMLRGWRRFGMAFFRPNCPDCRQCLSLRIPIETFTPNRSQKRAVKANRDVELTIHTPDVSEEKLRLHQKYHEYQHYHREWSLDGIISRSEYINSFVNNPFPVQEWQYRLHGKLIGVGYVDTLSVGLSAIYFFYDPDYRNRSLGTFNIMRLIETCREQGLPHLYLGYYVEKCQSLKYKANFRPNEILLPNGRWVVYRERGSDDAPAET